ncbi:hypothetical protein FBU59_004108 [Linderina macrospora]|uniref:Uncharacterized protein n=1 Tax=Linderina macrospora TaxID=4868 RepID=A0ACC1J6G7_9FUNG|nr:hypothetical protein FBU59_004108 [Linderina macrospora]
MSLPIAPACREKSLSAAFFGRGGSLAACWRLRRAFTSSRYSVVLSRSVFVFAEDIMSFRLVEWGGGEMGEFN